MGSIPSAGTVFLRYSTRYIDHENLVFQLSFLDERKHTPLKAHYFRVARQPLIVRAIHLQLPPETDA